MRRSYFVSNTRRKTCPKRLDHMTAKPVVPDMRDCRMTAIGFLAPSRCGPVLSDKHSRLGQGG